MIRLEIEGPGAAEAASVLRWWFNSPYFSRNSNGSAHPRLEVIVGDRGGCPEKQTLIHDEGTPFPSEISLVDDYLVSQIGSANPFVSVDKWVETNQNGIARILGRRRQTLTFNPEKALESIVCQFILDDLRYSAPKVLVDSRLPESEVEQFDDVLSTFLPTSNGLRSRQRYASNPEHTWLVPRELFPSLQMLLPELCALQSATSAPNSSTRSTSSCLTRPNIRALTAPHFYLITLIHTLLLWASYVMVRVLLISPKRLTTALERSTRHDRSFQSWRLAERPISVSAWFRLYARASGKA